MNAIQYFQWGGNSEKDIYEFDLTFLVKGLLKAYPKARGLIEKFSPDNVFNTSSNISDIIESVRYYIIQSKTNIKASDSLNKTYYPNISIEGDDVRVSYPSKVITEAYHQNWVPDNNIDKKLKDIPVNSIGFSHYSSLLTKSADGEYTFAKQDPNIYIGEKKVSVMHRNTYHYGAVIESHSSVTFDKFWGFGFSLGNVYNVYYTDTGVSVTFKDIANNIIVIEI